MAKTKTKAKTRGKQPAGPDIQEKTEQPDQQTGPVPNTRMAEQLAMTGSGAGTINRARMMTDMQQSVGNNRLSRMLDKPVQPKPVVGVSDAPRGAFNPADSAGG
jgi:hypothetical protein